MHNATSVIHQRKLCVATPRVPHPNHPMYNLTKQYKIFYTLEDLRILSCKTLFIINAIIY
jgi:hypothetical protein